MQSALLFRRYKEEFLLLSRSATERRPLIGKSLKMDRSVYSLSFDPDGDLLAVGMSDGRLAIYRFPDFLFQRQISENIRKGGTSRIGIFEIQIRVLMLMGSVITIFVLFVFENDICSFSEESHPLIPSSDLPVPYQRQHNLSPLVQCITCSPCKRNGF